MSSLKLAFGKLDIILWLPHSAGTAKHLKKFPEWMPLGRFLHVWLFAVAYTYIPWVPKLQAQSLNQD